MHFPPPTKKKSGVVEYPALIKEMKNLLTVIPINDLVIYVAVSFWGSKLTIHLLCFIEATVNIFQQGFRDFGNCNIMDKIKDLEAGHARKKTSLATLPGIAAAAFWKGLEASQGKKITWNYRGGYELLQNVGSLGLSARRFDDASQVNARTNNEEPTGNEEQLSPQDDLETTVAGQEEQNDTDPFEEPIRDSALQVSTSQDDATGSSQDGDRLDSNKPKRSSESGSLQARKKAKVNARLPVAKSSAAKESAKLPTAKEPANLPAAKEPANLPPVREPSNLPAAKEPTNLPATKESDKLPAEKEPTDLPVEKQPDLSNFMKKYRPLIKKLTTNGQEQLFKQYNIPFRKRDLDDVWMDLLLAMHQNWRNVKL